MTDGNENSKALMAMNFVEKLFEPEIILENSGVQDRELKEPFVIICNHTRRTLQNCLVKMDGALVRYAFNNHNICSLMAEDIMEKPIIRNMVKDLDCIPICRTGASTGWLRECVKKLKAGTSVVIFPEGTTVKDGDFTDFKPGFAMLAKLAGVKVLPVAVNSVYRPFTSGRLKLTVGTPQSLQLKDMSAASLKAESARFRKLVEDMFYSMGDEDIDGGDREFANI